MELWNSRRGEAKKNKGGWRAGLIYGKCSQCATFAAAPRERGERGERERERVGREPQVAAYYADPLEDGSRNVSEKITLEAYRRHSSFKISTK